MKHFYLFLFLSFTAFFAQAQVQNYSLGDIVDDFTVTDIEGNTHNLYEYTAAGKYVYLDFFFVSCSSCQATAPLFNEFYDKFGCGEGDIMCLTINSGSDNDAQVTSYDNTYGGSYNHAPIISGDGNAGAVRSNFGISYFPTVGVISPNNEIIVLDIWPIDDATTYEEVFPDGFDPAPMSCTVGFEEETITSFNLYPNPSNGTVISINLLNSDAAKISISNLLGKKVFTTNITSKNSEIYPDLAQGSYFVQIETDKGTSVRKLIVK